MSQIILHCALKNRVYSETLLVALRAAGHDARFVSISNWNDAQDGTVIVTHHAISDALRAELTGRGAHVIAGARWTRERELQFAEEFGISTLDWASPLTAQDAAGVFASWNATQVVKKRSGTASSSGVSVVGHPSLAICEPGDIVCRLLEVCPLYKVEMVGSEIVLAWQRQAEHYTSLNDPAAPKSRQPWTPCDELRQRLQAAGRRLAEFGIGHVAFDFLGDEHGQPRLIEVNTCNVALWWSEQQEGFCDAFSAAMMHLIEDAIARPIEQNAERADADD